MRSFNLKQSSLILSLFFVSFLYSQQKKSLFFDENWRIIDALEPRTYTCDCYVDDYQKFVGPFKCYHDETKALVKFYFFKQDLLHGEIKEYHLNGKIKLLAEYNYGEPINEWKEYDAEGNLTLQRTFNQESKVVKDYFVDQNPYDQLLSTFSLDEEPAIYTSECIMIKIAEQRLLCSEAALNAYFESPPIPPQYLKNSNFIGQDFMCNVAYRVNEKGIVDEAKVIVSTGDAFLDDLAIAHVLNMGPFEAAKRYGIPSEAWLEAQIPFKF